MEAPTKIRDVKKGRHCSLFRCACGKTFVTYKYNVLYGHTKSCGCAMGTHKKAGTQVHKAWQNMKTRCLNPNTPYYELWGGRGIKLHEPWNDFEAFFADMGEPPTDERLYFGSN